MAAFIQTIWWAALGTGLHWSPAHALLIQNNTSAKVVGFNEKTVTVTYNGSKVKIERHRVSGSSRLAVGQTISWAPTIRSKEDRGR